MVIEPHTTMETHGSKSLQDTRNFKPQQQGVHDMKLPNPEAKGSKCPDSHSSSLPNSVPYITTIRILSIKLSGPVDP